ncbi:MAG: tRNA pseudouridine(54/55) synthase Pus10 [Euryarchaeota archaeon]|nr:tRNA pseudouridine(54/55) synthase Pus10 [Euryarchaeota archaeon]
MQDILVNREDLKLCDHCLGRIYGMRGHGLTNKERGRALRVLFAMQHNESVEELEPEECALCGNIFERIPDYVQYIKKVVEDYEFDTFLVGSRFPRDIVEAEKNIQESHCAEGCGESISREFNRELGKALSDALGKEVDLSNPDLAIIIDTEYDDVQLEIKPLFIYGRYRKLSRELPQTKWPSGKYKESVEELIAGPIMELTGGTAHALHGMGREDIDVRMLGNGRPFVLEISRPRRRKINLKEIEERINSTVGDKVQVLGLRYSSRSEVRRVKTAKVRKRYRIAVQVELAEEELKDAIQNLRGKIRQRTPTRVAHRRADKVRVREVYDISLVGKEDDAWVIEVLAESGTYIKELMHGDNGRTKPSLAEITGKEVKVVYLDVVEVLDTSQDL